VGVCRYKKIRVIADISEKQNLKIITKINCCNEFLKSTNSNGFVKISGVITREGQGRTVGDNIGINTLLKTLYFLYKHTHAII